MKNVLTIPKARLEDANAKVIELLGPQYDGTFSIGFGNGLGNTNVTHYVACIDLTAEQVDLLDKGIPYMQVDKRAGKAELHAQNLYHTDKGQE